MAGIDTGCDTGTGQSWGEKLAKAKEYKQEGNEMYKGKSPKKAIGKYHRALLYLKGILEAEKPHPLTGIVSEMEDEIKTESRLPEDAQKEVASMMTDCYNNLAACLLQSEDPNYAKIQTYCDCVLERSPRNTKALYRKGVALYHLNRAEDAIAFLQKARAQPQGDKDPNIRRYLGLCGQQVSRQEQNLKQMYKTMIGQQKEVERDGLTNQNGTSDTLSKESKVDTS